MKNEKQWYIIHTYAGNELKLMYALEKKRFECYCPLYSPAGNGSRKAPAVPLLPNYLFVHITSEEQAAVRQAAGVINFMYWLNDCVVVSEEDMFTLKELANNYQVLSIEKIRVNAMATSVKEWATMPVNNTGVLDEEDIVKISFPAYGIAMMAKERKMNVRVININVDRKLQQRAGILYSR